MIDQIYQVSFVLMVFLVALFCVMAYVRTRSDDVYRCSNCFEPNLFGTCTRSSCVDYHKYNNPKYIQRLTNKEDKQNA